ncbi:vacuolar transporter chaperone protein [Gigaspora margarita]|uniref:Vacuolar transporter chaperone protein n=1 Tax=Gigaspora margarita TaxID=4874 RepID=A0A8H3XAY8_GIGMA|nr:vacuolar transporter chaperone protein [Gigaspora margarita]
MSKREETTSQNVVGPINFVIDVIVGALNLLKPIFSIVLALYLGWYSISFISSTFQNDLALAVCRLPLSSFIPLCQTPIPDFSRLVNRQVETYEQIMDYQLSHTGASSSLALDIKKAELATADLRTLIKYSSLSTSKELVDRLTEFVDKAKSVGRDLQILQSRTRTSLDNLITYNIFALKALENVRDNKISAKELAAGYNQMMTLIESDLKRMILVATEALGSLTDLDEMLIAIHDITTREGAFQKTERANLFAQMWTKLGGNVVKRQIFEENLQLLRDLDKQRRIAVSQIQTTLYSLTSFQLDLEELREHVSRPSLVEMPIEVHIENVGKGIERLRTSKVALKSSNDDGIRTKMIDSEGANNNNIKADVITG